MSLSASLSNALSGMRTSQNSLEVLSRNVANAGTPGYHRQSLSVIDTKGVNSTYARSGGIERAFNKSLQAYYTSAVSDTAYSVTRASTLERLQAFLGKPGDAGSLDTMFGSLQNALQALGASPDSYATRATVVSQSQAMAATLNALTRDIQGLRQEAETQISASVDQLNVVVGALQKINQRLGDQSVDTATRAALMDQRDRLVSEVAEIVDVRVEYRGDDTVSIMTRTGVGILDGKASTFTFESAGALTADKQFNTDPAQSTVGRLLMTTSSGTTVDLVQQRVLQSGRLAALVALRDDTLVAAQSQLDEIAAGLSQALSTVTTEGTAASSGSQNGFALDLAPIRDGNDFTLSYTQGGASRTIKVVRVDDGTKLPLDYMDANGARVIGMDFSGGAAAVAAALSNAIGSGISVSASGSTLTVLDDGAGNTTDIGALTGHATSTAVQNGTAALNLFVDRGNSDFTNSLSGKAQKLGFAGRIAVNSSILTDNTLLVKATSSGSLGDATRPDYLLNQLQTMSFASAQDASTDLASFRMNGTVSDLIAQTMDFTGNIAASAISDEATQELTMETITQRLDSEYGVNVDEEMARLMELQNAYAANSRVIGIVQDLLQRLMDI
jgi:flagellar hook-associated protein 1 FlgK